MIDVDTGSPVIYYAHTDHLGRPVKLTNSAKSSVWDAVWLPFGGAPVASLARGMILMPAPGSRSSSSRRLRPRSRRSRSDAGLAGLRFLGVALVTGNSNCYALHEMWPGHASSSGHKWLWIVTFRELGEDSLKPWPYLTGRCLVCSLDCVTADAACRQKVRISGGITMVGTFMRIIMFFR